MINFVHVSDTHLGGSNFKLIQREDDFLDAFRQVIDYCVKEKPEIVIHSGDLFDRGKPGNKVLLFTIKQLKRLKAEAIPLFIIPGSHDMSVDGTFITVLEKVGLLTNIAKPENFKQQGGQVIMKGEEYHDFILYGIPGRRANISRIYKSLRPSESNKFRIFMFHHIITNVKGAEFFSDIPISLLPKGMDYYAGGHWHEHEEFTYNGKPVIYPGSTEFCDIDTMEREKERGFIHYKGRPSFIKLKTRKVIVKKINCNNLSPEQATNKCLNSLDGHEGLIILKLYGTLSTGRRSDIDSVLIRERAVNNGYLHCNVRISNLCNPDEVTVNFGSKTVLEIEDEFLKKKNYNNDELMLARQLINLLGNNLKPVELSKTLDEVSKLL